MMTPFLKRSIGFLLYTKRWSHDLSSQLDILYFLGRSMPFLSLILLWKWWIQISSPVAITSCSSAAQRSKNSREHSRRSRVGNGVSIFATHHLLTLVIPRCWSRMNLECSKWWCLIFQGIPCCSTFSIILDLVASTPLLHRGFSKARVLVNNWYLLQSYLPWFSLFGHDLSNFAKSGFFYNFKFPPDLLVCTSITWNLIAQFNSNLVYTPMLD